MRQFIRHTDSLIGSAIMRWPESLKPLMQLFTLLGQPVITIGVVGLLFFYGATTSNFFYLQSSLLAFVTIVMTSLIKLFLRRARPKNDYVKNMLFQTYSFPSGHAAGALISYGLLAVYASVKWPELALLCWIVALILSFLIGVSRVFLGAHYASDVFGGWLIGAIGLLFIIFVL